MCCRPPVQRSAYATPDPDVSGSIPGFGEKHTTTIEKAKPLVLLIRHWSCRVTFTSDYRNIGTENAHVFAETLGWCPLRLATAAD